MRNNEKPNQSTHADYTQRVNRAIDAIVTNLDKPLNLAEAANAASFSPYHFHRVFQSIVGETPSQFAKRIRLERALYMMSHDPAKPLTTIALACGFASSSDFTRSFKQRYEVPPSAFDINTWRDSKRGNLEQLLADHASIYHVKRLPVGENPDAFTAELRSLPARTVAYIRVHNPYTGTAVVEAAKRLIEWAEAHNVADRQWLGYQWDDPEIVDLKDCRYDVAVEVDHVEPTGEIGRFDFPAMKVAHVEIKGGIDLEMRAIDWLYTTWLPSSGYVPDDQPAFEAWNGRPFAHGYEHFELALQLPIKKENIHTR